MSVTSTDFTSSRRRLGRSILGIGAAMSVPAFAAKPKWRRVAYTSDTHALPHFAVNGGWSTSIQILNFEAKAASWEVNFYDDNGRALAVPIAGQSRNLSSLSGTAPSGGGSIITLPNTAATTVSGWGLITANESVGAQAILRQEIAGRTPYEATVFTDSDLFASKIAFFFDNTNGRSTGLAICNPDEFDPATYVLRFRTLQGVSIRTERLTLPTNGHRAFSLPALYSTLQNMQGIAEIENNLATPGVLGLRFDPGGAFTTLVPMDTESL